MMKTSIAVCALLNMMGSNAVSLLARDAIECPSVDAPQSLAQVATTTGPYSPSAMQNEQLRNLFRDFADKDDNGHDSDNATRMSFKQFATLLRNFRITPENRDCTTEDDSAFYERFMADGCTNSRVNFNRPRIVRCDGFVQYCQDAGRYRAFNAHQPDSTGLDNSLSSVQFQQSIAALDAEMDTSGAGEIYKTMTNPGIGADRVSAALYEFISIFTDTGSGGDGSYTQTVCTTVGSSNTSEITHHVTAEAEAHQSWVTGGVSGGVTYDFGAAFTNINTQAHTEAKHLELDFGVPNYVYMRRVTLFMADGRVDTIIGGAPYISHVEGGEAFRRRVTFSIDGTVANEEVLTCAVCN